MTKVNDSIRAAVLSDSSLSNKELQSKYGLSRSTIQRIQAAVKEDVQTVEIPNLNERATEYFTPPAVEEAPIRTQIPDNAVLDRLFKGLDAPPPSPQLEAPQPREAELSPSRKELIARILLNVDTFPNLFPFAADRTKFLVELGQYSIADLTGLLENVETTRSTTNFSAQLKNVFFVVSRATETLGGLVKLKANGLTDALLQQQQELDYIFKELAIQYGDSFKGTSRPEVRLAFLFGMALLQTDSTNRLKERLKPKTEAVREETNKKYADL
jgi:hypothetical protein